MKKSTFTHDEKVDMLIFAILIILTIFGCDDSDAAVRSVTRSGNRFTIEASNVETGASKMAQSTIYTFVDTDGKEYPVYVSKNGRAYIVRTSKKTGNEYKKYLPEQTSREICKELGIEYKEKKSK